ncbi:MAG: deoxyribose-phosphate aldolase [Deltaproteobacteria bacterium]|nr:deoxyribose-phosphate aldolase [Deltaproteobacteria bacterium]
MATLDVFSLAEKIDYTLLRPNATLTDFTAMLERARLYPFASVCVPPSIVEFAKATLKSEKTPITTVIGFPLGFQTLPVKMLEAREALINGATELDIVMNITYFKSGDYKYVRNELKAITASVPEIKTKIIIETSMLTKDEIKEAVELIAASGARFVKTSTGFGSASATTPEDIRLLKELCGSRLLIKASGGIKTLQNAMDMLNAGADRLGVSSAVEILAELKGKAS